MTRAEPAGLLLLSALAGCMPADERWPCSISLTTSGAVELDWSDEPELSCDGFGPSINDSIDLYWSSGYDKVRIRLDYVAVEATGEFTDTFVSVTHNGDEWGAFQDVSCPVSVDSHEPVGSGFGGSQDYAISGTASCDQPLVPFGGDGGKVELSTIEFENWYDEWE